MNLLQKLWIEIIWHLVTKTLRVLFILCARVRVVYYHKVPKRGAFILAANHVSHFDPPVFSAYSRRKIDWIAMAELFKTPFGNRFFTDLNVIPIDRSGADRAALRTAVKRLQAGRVVGIFPEGGIRDRENSIVNGAAMRPGVALLAAMSGAQVIPAVILGSDRLYNAKNLLPWRRCRIWVAYGAPIVTPDNLAGDEKRTYVSRELAAAIIDLKDRLVSDFHLTANDLPQPPRERMQEP